MAGNIKGITIEFRGDTTKLDKALRELNNEARDLDREFKAVDKALKFNPSNVDLWRQKQDILNEKIQTTTEKMNLMKETLKKADNGEIELTAQEYRQLQREVVECESKIKTFTGQLKKIGNINLRATSEQFKQIGTKLEAAGRAMSGLSTAAAAVAASIGALTVKSAKWADDIITSSKVYSMSTKELQKYKAAADLVDVSADAIASTHRKLERNMLNAQLGSKKQALAFEELGISYENTDGTLRDSEAVWQDTIDALSKMENETERDAYAMALMGRSATDLNPLIEDGAEGYKLLTEAMQKYDLEFVDDETLQKANDFNDLLDVMRSIGTIAFQQLGTQLAAYLAPALEKVVDLVGRLANWFSQLSPRTQAIIAAIAGVVAVAGPLLIGLGKVAFGISSIINLIAVVGPAIGGIVAALGPVILIIGAVVAAGVLLYKNWDTIKAKAIALKNNIINVFNQIKARVVAIWNGIKTAITTPITNAINTVKNAIQKIKNIINGAHLSLPKFKLPHFRISGGKLPWGIGGKGTAPKISVDWYAQGGIFDRASIIGVGEAGAEAVVPLDKLWDKLDNMSGETNIVININGSNKDPREIAEEVKRVLIMETNQRRLAWQ